MTSGQRLAEMFDGELQRRHRSTIKHDARVRTLLARQLSFRYRRDNHTTRDARVWRMKRGVYDVGMIDALTITSVAADHVVGMGHEGGCGLPVQCWTW